ncbi:hypothetical protein [Actinotalea fermentans]|uniref:Uncharacterized protein n=1 Tax=Actinotalea fermentans TaxID=43671 RepID=A0A511YUR9_9CELL|nr:hypothetical protein [Actinotalea fermentans]KGM17963.1 hypothetical protein N867_00490 [Actinotalea fermentans ATCC 43279 = JCM 9966 = DSM 3133]GEN78940.1 hypothetical protein AFE02nite_06740 [Actinotalea fermentans]
MEAREHRSEATAPTVVEPAQPTDTRGQHRHAETPDTAGATERVELARESVARQREAFGGMRLGAAFFGFLAAAGMAVLLTAVAVAAGTAVGVGTDVDADLESGDVATIGLWGAVVVGLLVLVAYYCGGYVAGRMARFDGAKQGFAVWLWALVVAVVVAVLTALVGAEYNVFAQVNLFPRIPVDEGDLTTVGVVAAFGAAALALVGSVLGGLVGVRFHRKVDRAGLGL